MPHKNKEDERAYQKAYKAANKENIKLLNAVYYKANREKILTTQKARQQANAEKIASYLKAYRKINAEKISAKAKAYREANSEQTCLRNAVYRQANREKCRAIVKAYAKANPKKIQAKNRGWRQANREKIATHNRLRHKQDLNYKLKRLLGSRVRALLAGKNKSESTLRLIGCDIGWLIAWLEVQFKLGMTWENYGPIWHIDHKRPCASFDLTDQTQQKLCFHWTNLQPLFATENLSKGSKWKDDEGADVIAGLSPAARHINLEYETN